MSLPKKTLASVVARFDELISEAEIILSAAETVPATYGHNESTGRSYEQTAAYRKPEWPRYVEWRTKSASLLCYVLPVGNVHRKGAEQLPNLTPTEAHIEYAIGILRAVKSDLESGFLDRIEAAIEAEIASDYMGQAEQLLGEGQRGAFDHVPAAVLSGAVLEKALKKLCSEQQVPISLLTTGGDHKTLNPLIDDLKKAGQFNELKAKQLRAWADIRNKAAHGDFDQFNRGDVEQMLQGVTNFLADHLK